MSTSQWREKAGGFLSSSSFRLRAATVEAKEAAIVAGISVSDAADKIADAAERAGSAVRARWALLRQKKKPQHEQKQEQQQSQQNGEDTVQARLLSAAASTSTILKKGFIETKERVAVGRVKVEEVARKAAIRSRSIIASIEWWQRGSSGRGVFGVPLEVLVQRQKSPRPIPQIVTRCVDFLVLQGLQTENIFKNGGNQFVVERLVDLYNEDWNSPLVDGVSPIDVASLIKVYLRALPEPILMFHLYDDVVNAGESVRRWRDIVAKLPYANYCTLECLTSLLLRISELSSINKMDARSLAFELAPLLLWKKEESSNSTRLRRSRSGVKSSGDGKSGNGEVLKKSPSVSVTFVNVKDASRDWEGDVNGQSENDRVDLSAQIPLDDEPTLIDFAIVEAVQCLIDQHNSIFADAAEAAWQDIGGS